MQEKHDRDVGAMSKSMLIVMIFMMVSKATGFLREMVFASSYGLSQYTDAYKAAFDLPTIALSVVVTALSATLIPVYTGRRGQGKEVASRFASNLFTLGLILSAVIVLLTAIFRETLVLLLLPSADAQTQQLAMRLAGIMMPMGLFVFLARLSSAFLQANFRFTIPALAPLFLNLTIIASIVISGGAKIEYVAVGALVGWVFQFLVQVPQARKCGLGLRPVFDVKDPGIREVAILMLPVLVSSAFDQMYLVFDKAVASGVVGDITALDLSNRVNTMVSAVLLTTVATVLYPSLVRDTGDRGAFSKNLAFGVNLNLLIALPCMAALILLREPVTRLVYERGAFDREDTLRTSVTLACYAAGLIGVGMRELCNRSFYAFKDPKIPTGVGILAVLLNIGLNYALYPVWGSAGIAAGTAIASIVSGGLLLLLLHKKRKVVDGKRIARCLWRVLAATACMSAALLALSAVLGIGEMSGRAFMLSMLGMVAVGIIVYGGVLALLKTEEIGMAFGFIKKKLKKG